MADEVDVILGKMRDTFGTGQPTTTQTAGGPLHQLADAPRNTAGWSGDGRNGYQNRTTQNAADTRQIANGDDKIPQPVNSSADATTTGRNNMQQIITDYTNGKRTLAPISNTAAGQGALLGLKSTKLTQGAQTVDSSNNANTERAAQVRAYAAKYLQQQIARNAAQQAQSNTIRNAMIQSAVQQSQQQQQLRQVLLTAAIKQASTPSTTVAPTMTTASPGQQTLGDPAALVTGGNTKGAAAAKVALSKLGAPYIWGATGPSTFDCSGLTQYSYKQVGIDLPRTTYDQVNVGTRVDQAHAQRGDLVFSNFSAPGRPEHVQMYLGNGKVVEAPQPGERVQISNIPSNTIIKHVG